MTTGTQCHLMNLGHVHIQGIPQKGLVSHVDLKMGNVLDNLQRSPQEGQPGGQLQLLHELNQLRRVNSCGRASRSDILRRQLMQVDNQTSMTQTPFEFG